MLPRFYGLTLRGALGLTFRRMVCITHLPECAPCLLRFQCPYSRFFEPAAPTEHPFAKRLSQMPCPFALQVPSPAEAPQAIQEGDPFVFRLTLWHHAEVLLPYIVIATQRTLDKGLGKSVRAKLWHIVAESNGGETLVYDAEEGIVTTALPTVPLERVSVAPTEPVLRLIVRFITPTRIDLSGKLQHPISFSALIKAANERGWALFWAYEQTEPPWDGKALVKASETVRQIRSEQRWLDLERYSRRQQEKLKVGGTIGWAEFEGNNLAQFLPLLKLMEFVHVGKLATMGLGQIAVTTCSRHNS